MNDNEFPPDPSENHGYSPLLGPADEAAFDRTTICPEVTSEDDPGVTWGRLVSELVRFQLKYKWGSARLSDIPCTSLDMSVWCEADAAIYGIMMSSEGVRIVPAVAIMRIQALLHSAGAKLLDY